MATTGEDIFGALIGTSRVNQNQQMLDLESQKLDLNRQILEQNSGKANTNIIVIISIIALLMIGVGAYLLFFRK